MEKIFENKEYKSKEELVEILKKSKGKIKGSFMMVDSVTGKSEAVDLYELIDKVGYEKVAEIIMNTSVKEIVVNSDEAKALLEKYVINKDSLTPEEKQKVYAYLSQMKDDFLTTHAFEFNFMSVLMSLIVDTNKTSKDPIKNGALIAITLSLLQDIITSCSPSLAAYKNDRKIVNTIGDQIGEQILDAFKKSMPNPIPTDLLILGLMNAFGNTILSQNSSIAMDPVDVDYMIQVKGLDKEAIVEDTKDTLREDTVKILNETSVPQSIKDGLNKITEELKNEVTLDIVKAATKEEKHVENIDQDFTKEHNNVVNIDIRNRLKNNRNKN